MGMEERGLNIDNTLKGLCLSNGWCYGVFWHFDPRNHMLSTMEDAYFDKHVESVVNNMLPGRMIGEGKIGQAALDGKHRWIFLDALTEECKTKRQIASWDDSEFGIQLLFGIKTVAVIPVESEGVLQFGSTKEISETPEFLDQAKKFLLDEESFVGVAPGGRASSSFNSDYTDLNGLSASVTSSQNSFYGDLSTSWESFFETMRSFSTIDSLPFSAKTIDGRGRDWCSGEGLIIDPNLGSLVTNSIFEDRPSNLVDTFYEQYEPLQLPASLFDPCQIDDVSQWLADSSNLCLMGLDAMAFDDVTHTMEVDCKSSGLGGSDLFSDIQGKKSADSSHSSSSNALNSSEEGECFLAPLDNGQLLGEFGLDFESQKLGNCWKDIMIAVGNKGDSLPVQTDSGLSISECISGTEGGSTAAPRKGLFSELGLEHLFSAGPCSSTITKSCIDDKWRTKKRRIENNQTDISKHMQLLGQSTEVKWMQPLSSGGLRECEPKSQAGVWINDSCSRDAKSCISGANTQTRRSEEPIKATKKRAKPGESTRPRPKDRQMIADRIKELRDIIPDGAKLSIDALLGRTIKHMLFMQSLAKHADKLKQVNEPKLIGEDNGLVRNGISSTSPSCGGNRSRGVTWAFEVGGTNLFCPIVVEDLSHPGQMLIEMLCEEQGYFLEIVDIIRDLGLTILKGVMEARDDKIWAHFIVEGNRHVNVTRMEVFVSLMQLLQGSGTCSGGNKNIEPAGKVASNEAQAQAQAQAQVQAPLWSNYQQQQVVTLAI